MFAGLPGEIRVCALLGTQRGKIPFTGPKRIAPEMEYVVSVAPIGAMFVGLRRPESQPCPESINVGCLPTFKSVPVPESGSSCGTTITLGGDWRRWWALICLR